MLFQLGSFFETYFEDAKIFSVIAGITEGSRKIIGDTILCAGINASTVTTYIKLLLDNGYKVCVCTEEKNQFSKPTRKITRIYTQGTIIENELLENSENNFIMAIYKYKNNFLLSYADVSTGQFYKTSVDFETLCHEIYKILPNELLISKTQQEIFEQFLPKFNVTLLDEKYFDKNIEKTILKYCLNTQKTYLIELNDVIEYIPQTYMLIDEITRRNLELTKTKRYLNEIWLQLYVQVCFMLLCLHHIQQLLILRQTQLLQLMWFLNYTKTPMGSRLLKKYISEPLMNLSEIKKRQQAISELIENKETLFQINELLISFFDISRICAHMTNSTISPKDLYNIANNADKIRILYDILKKLKSPLLKMDKENTQSVIYFIETIKRAIKDTAPKDTKNGGIINEGYDSNLDYLNSKLNSISDEIEKYRLKEIKRTGIEKLKLGYMSAIGFYFEVTKAQSVRVPDDYFKKQGLANCVRYSTNKLSELEEEYGSLKFKINELNLSSMNK